MYRLFNKRNICRIFGHNPGYVFTRQLASPPTELLWNETERERRLDNGELAHPKGFMHPSWTGYLPDHSIASCKRCSMTIRRFDNKEDEKLANSSLEVRKEHFYKLGYS